MDFITELPLLDECDQLGVVIDRFTEMAHFIPLCEKTMVHLAIIFAKEVWKHHSLPADIVSDLDSCNQEFYPGCQPCFIHKQTVKPNDSTNPSRYTSQLLWAMSSKTGPHFSPWPSLRIINWLWWVMDCLHFMPIMVFILLPMDQPERSSSTRPVHSTPTGYKRYTRSPASSSR